MKLLCVACDEPMRLEGAEGPEEGSLAVIFACPRCPNKVAMLTNQWETQLVRALDVRLGGPGAHPAPLQFVRSTLANKREDLEIDGPVTAAEPDPEGPLEGAVIRQSGPTHQVAGSPDGQIAWSPEAERRLERVPDFIRPMARQGIERFAAERGYRRITEDVMDEARTVLGLKEDGLSRDQGEEP